MSSLKLVCLHFTQIDILFHQCHTYWFYFSINSSFHYSMDVVHPTWDEYEKVAKLGSGSYGTVYKVRKKGMHRLYIT